MQTVLYILEINICGMADLCHFYNFFYSVKCLTDGHISMDSSSSYRKSFTVCVRVRYWMKVFSLFYIVCMAYFYSILVCTLLIQNQSFKIILRVKFAKKNSVFFILAESFVKNYSIQSSLDQKKF